MTTKRSIVLSISLALLCSVLMPLHGQTSSSNLPSRAIHVIYDDSGSMIRNHRGGVWVYNDRWAQAKYAMEVFAAMLQENDVMRIYYMSDFNVGIVGNPNARARLTLLGSEPAATRVARVHNTITPSANTPFDPVIQAFNDLRNENVDEKWLVVLTDGVFNRLGGQWIRADVEYHYSRFVNELHGVNIIHFAIGDDAATITADPGRNIFFYHAVYYEDIVGMITSVSNQIFNRSVLRFDNYALHEFSFDVPMSELFVFAQGPNVRVSGIVGDRTFSPIETVNVRYSEVAATNFRNHPNVIIPRDLNGVVAVFRDIPIGRYRLDIAGAQMVEIYFKPVVNVAVRLYQRRGREIRTQEIPEGEYRIEFGFVDDNGNFFESELLGNIRHEAVMENGGQTVRINSGDIITLKEGNLRIHIVSHFLDFNTAEYTMTRSVRFVPFHERPLFWILVFLLLLLLIYLLWGRKKRFPKYMVRGFDIHIEKEDGSRLRSRGSFKKDKKTVWMPLCPEIGIINASAGRNPLPRLKVKALGDERMELVNIREFAGNLDFFINDQSIPEDKKYKDMRCKARIKSVFTESGGLTTQYCSFQGSNRKKKSKKKK